LEKYCVKEKGITANLWEMGIHRISISDANYHSLYFFLKVMFFISLFTFYVIISVIYLTFTALFFLCRALLMVFV